MGWGLGTKILSFNEVTMTTFSIRGIDEQMAELLKQEAKRRGISVTDPRLKLWAC
jgi:hypothetical protein